MKDTDKNKDGSVKMKNGKMMVMTNDSQAAMTNCTSMSNGTQVITGGTVMMKDGKNVLKNGEWVKPNVTMKKM